MTVTINAHIIKKRRFKVCIREKAWFFADLYSVWHNKRKLSSQI